MIEHDDDAAYDEMMDAKLTQKRADRYDAGKLRIDLIPPEFIEVLAEIFTRGAQKYADHNWKLSVNTEDHEKFQQDRMGSMLRHILAYQKGEVLDPELGTFHLGQAAWNALAIMYYDIHSHVMAIDTETLMDGKPVVQTFELKPGYMQKTQTLG